MAWSALLACSEEVLPLCSDIDEIVREERGSLVEFRELFALKLARGRARNPGSDFAPVLDREFHDGRSVLVSEDCAGARV